MNWKLFFLSIAIVPLLGQAALTEDSLVEVGDKRIRLRSWTTPVAWHQTLQVTPTRPKPKMKAGELVVVPGPGVYNNCTGTVILTVDENGEMAVEIDTSKPIFLGGAPDKPGPDPPPDPPVSLSSYVREQTAVIEQYDGRAQHVMGLRILYEAVAAAIRGGQIATGDAVDRIQELRMQLWAGDASRWAPWRTLVDARVDVDDLAGSYDAIAAGLSPEGDALPAIGDSRILERLIGLIVSGEAGKIIEFIMQLIAMFGGLK